MQLDEERGRKVFAGQRKATAIFNPCFSFSVLLLLQPLFLVMLILFSFSFFFGWVKGNCEEGVLLEFSG